MTICVTVSMVTFGKVRICMLRRLHSDVSMWLASSDIVATIFKEGPEKHVHQNDT